MAGEIDHDILDDALRRCGASWDAAQSHGAMTARIATVGPNAMPGVLGAILEGTEPANALRRECENLLASVLEDTHLKLAARQSEFMPLLPDESDSAGRRIEAIAHWSEGFLHGLVTGQQDEQMKRRLAAEPIADIIKDLLQMTRATLDESETEEESEEAYAEIVEYLRVATQLVYEELDELRAEAPQ